MAKWVCAMKLNEDRSVASGSEEDLCAAIRRGADLRIGTEFRNNEHIDPTSSDAELIREFADFRITYLIDGRWTAGICNLRMPVALPDSFGPRESMSFFLYNQNAQQAIARPYLDGRPTTGPGGATPEAEPEDMPRYTKLDSWDDHSNAPSENFVYDFDYYSYCVCDRWEEVLAHNADGSAKSGSIEPLAEAFSIGGEIKVAIRGLCADMTQPGENALDHEVFVHLGSCYYYTEKKIFVGAAQPLVRVSPAVPLVYKSGNWDFGWLILRTDGFVARWLCNPYTLKFKKSDGRYAIRWFVGK